MRCAKCGTEGVPGKKFCAECGSPLSNRCPNCNADNAPGAKFCADCGGALAKAAGAEGVTSPVAAANGGIRIAAERQNSDAIDGERKTVTALFADLKGSTALMEELDPEAAHATVDPVLRIMVEAVHRYEGYVARTTGDGIFALFGAPIVYEDHPQRALYAALEMQQALRAEGQRRAAKGLHALEARVGVHTGEVVAYTVETDGKVEYRLAGHTANLAARLESLASAGSIATSEYTRQLCEGYFELRGLGPVTVKGLSAPIDVYEVLGLGPLRTHFQLAARRGLTRFVGRERELAQLQRTLDQAMSGQGQVVAVIAEAGTGKSRLFYEFKATIPTTCKVLEAYSVSHGKASAWLPVLELLRGYFGVEDTDDAASRRAKVHNGLTALDPALDDTLPYLFGLLGIVEGLDPIAQMDPQIKRQRTLEAIKRIVLRESLKQPVVVIFEDLHWIDAQTQALLDSLADSVANFRVLLLFNYRPEYRHEWTNKSYYSQLRLDPLGGADGGMMLAALLGESVELNPLKRLITERTGGNPFFIEEIVQALFDEGALLRNGAVKMTRSLSQLKLPPTVQGILAARIDQQPAEHKQLLQTLAVLGREFTLKLVQRVTLKSNDKLDRMLAQLQLGEFIYQQPAIGEVKYTFKHALTQEVAYKSLLSERRRALHDCAACALEELYAEQLNDHYGDLAHHYLLSDNADKATRYAQLAAQQAISRGSYVEASSLIGAALKLVDRLPDGNERLRGELVLRSTESMLTTVLYGGPSLQREQVLKRMCQIGESLGEADQLLRGLVSLCGVYFLRGESLLGLELSHRCLELVESMHDPGVLADAYFAAGNLAFSSGKLREAASYHDVAAPHYNRSDRGLSLFGIVSSVTRVQAITLQLLGRVVESVRTAEEGLRHVRESKHLYSLGLTLVLKSILHFMRREPDIARRDAEEAIALSEQHGFYWFDIGRVALGCALTKLGQFSRAIVEMEQGISGQRSRGGASRLQYYIAQLAWNYASLGQTEKALTMLNEGLAHTARTGEKVDDAEMLRLKGEVLLMHDADATAEVESCFRASVEVARVQEAKWWELRASVNLARLLWDTGRRDEAWTMLAGIYNWFTEGFDLPDLKEAKALLEELGA